MNPKVSKPSLLKASIAAAVLLFASSAALAAPSTVTLTAGPTTTALPDGQSVPMWGYTCGDVLPAAVPSVLATCTAMSGSAQSGTSWQPPLITVAAGQSLEITLVNNLSFGSNNIPTSLVIVGQLGGGLGDITERVTVPSPTHAPYGTTWPGTAGGTTPDDAVFTPPAQSARVRSFGTEVNAGSNKVLTWAGLRAGTYLIESGTQPSIQGPMGLYGVLVVTEPDTATPAHQAYGTPFDTSVALLLSEIDPVQNAAVAAAVNTSGFDATAVWKAQPGTCGDASVHTCYPPAVNYTPLYYLINGQSFDATNAAATALAVPAAGAQTRVLLRFVNAGLRMHVPSAVGANFTLLAEDSNKVPGVARVQSEVFLAAGKTYDVTVKPAQSVAGTYDPATFAVFDRALGLSTGNQRNGGMQTYIQVAGGALPATGTALTGDTNKNYFCTTGAPLSVMDPGLGVLAGAKGANGAALSGTYTGAVTSTNLIFQSNGTFTYTPPNSGACGGSFSYTVNGSSPHVATITQCDSAIQGAGCAPAGAPVANDVAFKSTIATRYASAPPGVLGANVVNASGHALTAAVSVPAAGGTVTLSDNGSFVANKGAGVACPGFAGAPAGASCVTFGFQAKNSQGTPSNTATAAVVFQAGTLSAVNVKDAKNGVAIEDYRWIIEEDKTFWIEPKCQINSAVRPAGCAPLPVESLGYSFHTANMPVVASGCVGAISCEQGQQLQGVDTVCDIGNGACRAGTQKDEVPPTAVHLDPNKRYFISILPGDGVNTTIGGAGGPQTIGGNDVPFDIDRDCGPYDPSQPLWKPGNLGSVSDPTTALCGHGMGGAQIAAGQSAVNIVLQETPLPTAKISVFVFEDDNPLNGENDAGGGIDVIAPNEPGLGGFQLEILDQAGGLGDSTGQATYDEFGQPLSNSLANYIDPISGLDACPINSRGDGLLGMILTCPKYESDGTTESPLAGQAVIANLYPGLYEIVAAPAADRIAKGEEWLQTNTLDGGKAHEAFIKANEPGYFQEFGPGGFHIAIGFANPQIIRDRKAGVCAAMPCNATLNVVVTGAHMSRTPDQRIFSTNSYDIYGFTQCYVSIGTADGEDFAIEKCDADGNVSFTGMPTGDYKLTVFDQWNDLMLDGLVSSVRIDGNNTVQEFPVTQWRSNLSTRTFIDTNGDGVSQETEPGLTLVNTNIRYRDGSFGFFNNTDLAGNAGFNEVFPFMNWLVVETTSSRYKQTGIHTVYDTGGPVDGSTIDGSTSCVGSGVAPCGNSTIGAGVANTFEKLALPLNQRVPGAVYCANADCTGQSIQNPGGSTTGTCTTNGTTGITTCTGVSAGRIDPPQPWGPTEAWQGLLGQTTYMEFGMKAFAPGENGGIQGHVIYASTRPFDDPALSLQLSWEPGVPRVQINLYQETIDESGNKLLTLVDHTTSTSWDDWAQGFRSDGVPNMNCPGQDPTSPFFQTLKDSKQWLDPAKTALTNHSLNKCYDGWSQMNQVQPAPYDGMYKFPSITGRSPTTGKPLAGNAGTNCTVCTPKPNDSALANDYLQGSPMLPAGKYVVEVVVPPGFELVKEEDKNILLGDVYIAPVTQQFAGFGNVFIMPDQAAVGAYYNGINPGNLNLTTNLGASPRHEGDTGSVESFWPCVGTPRQVPDLNSLYPGAGQAASFAGATRNLCDRKEVILEDQATVLAKFYIFSSTNIAGHFTGMITNDFASEFDPFSPQFGEKFGPPNLPVGMRDFTGNEVARVYSDQWGLYNGLYYSTYSVNPPAPTGYVPQMSIACMNDPGPIPNPANPSQMITDPAYSPAYSNFCYETPFMPGFTAYMDTPVIPTQAFADGYNLPDSEYPDLTPAIGSVVGSSGVAGPWVSASGATLTISCLGADNAADPCSKVVQNPNFSGPNAATAPYNQKTLTRHYGFGTSGTVTIAGVAATCSSWTNAQLTCTVPAISNTLNTTTGVGSTCYNGTSNTIPAGQTPPPRFASGLVDTTGLINYRCGQLSVTRGDNGKKSIDAITVTVAGRTPTVVTPSSPSGHLFGQTFANPLQNAIDNATAGDLIIVAPGTYRENLIMWKPVRLQGVGAASVTINADAHPAGRLDPWRRQVACLFGLTVDGAPNLGNAHFDRTGTYSCPAGMYMRSDRIPFEGFVGWDASGNGNLAQVLQEPTLMGAYEGAGITVVGRGVRIPNNSFDFWGQSATAGAYPDGSTYLTNSTANCRRINASTNRDYGTGNFLCNPSRIDGVSVINSSQGGGAVFVHGWNHNLEIANTRIYGNHGTLSGGINLGNGETPPVYINDGAICGLGSTALCPPFPITLYGTEISTLIPNSALPAQLNVKAHLHHNMIIDNASVGDALFSGTPSGAGGITVSAGADAYKIDHNWVAGNLSTGDGGGIQHAGLSFNGLIQNNWIVFNQSTNPTLPTNGGGISVTGAASDRTLANGLECGSVVDADCPPGIGDGAGQGNVVDANLILGNSAESGSGGGLRLQQINGSEVGTFATGSLFGLEANLLWYGITVTNNVIVNNVAGWDGGGVSMQDSLKVNFTNNTVASNDSTATAGALFKTLGAINSSAPPPGCVPTPNPADPQNPLCLIPNAPHDPQPAGLVTMENTPNLIASLPATVVCPAGYNYGNSSDTLATRTNGLCKQLSMPAVKNDMFWQNRSFRVDIVGPGSGNQSQQNIIALTPALNQAATGSCEAGAKYWDVGVRGDSSPTIHSNASGATLTLTNSIATSTSGVNGSNNVQPGNSPVIQQFCNGARVAPENCINSLDPATCHGYNAPPGRSETTGLSTAFLFDNIKPAATVDEGHNWLNLTYGPLTLSRAVNVTPTNAPELMVASRAAGTNGGAYSIPGTSAAVNRGFVGIPILSPLPATAATDYFGNARSINTVVSANPPDIGAVEYPVPAGSTLVVVNPAPLAFGSVVVGTTTTRDLTVSNNGTTVFTFTNSGTVTGAGYSRLTASVPNNCAFALAPGGSCIIRVRLIAPASATASLPGSVAITGSATVTNAPVALSASAVAASYTATVGPSPLAFGNWATGTTSSTQNLTVINTGNANLTSVGTAAALAAPFSRVTTGTFPATAPSCSLVTSGNPLLPGALCTIKVQYAPTASTTSTQNVTVTAAGVGVATVTPTPVQLSGSGVAAKATASTVPSPFTMTLLSGTTTDQKVMQFTNTAPTNGTGAQLTVNTVTVTGGTASWFFNKVANADTCTGRTLLPGSSCTVEVQFTIVSGPRAPIRTGQISFASNGAVSPLNVPLKGHGQP